MKSALHALLIGSLTLTFSCGKQTFNVTNGQLDTEAPGSIVVPAKVDIVLALDDTGSIQNIQNTIAAEYQKFVSTLDSQSWDYRFVTIPLTQLRQIDQVLASKYDSNHGAAYVPPYAGAPASTLSPTLFRNRSNYSGFVMAQMTSGSERGLENIASIFSSSNTTQNVLRPDALPVILIVSNGDDTSAPVQYINQMPTVVDPGNALLTGFVNQIKAARPSVKIYAAVNTAGYRSNCLGSASWTGTRYMTAVTQTGGKSYDLCTSGIGGVLSQLAGDLQGTRMEFRTSTLFIAQEPNVATIKVYKKMGGIEYPIPQDSVNGWSYVGYGTYPSIDYPTALDVRTGYAIRLNGNARLNGSDTARVEFLPYGVNP
jgi:hypothetical protein